MSARKNTFKFIFDEATVEELLLMKRLVDSDNQPQRVEDKFDWGSRKVRICDIDEPLYEIVNECVVSLSGFSLFCKVNINVIVFERFKKAFEKYGAPRVPFSNEGEDLE